MRHGGAGGNGRAAAHGDNDVCEDEGGGGKCAEANPDMMSWVQTKVRSAVIKRRGERLLKSTPLR